MNCPIEDPIPCITELKKLIRALLENEEAIRNLPSEKLDPKYPIKEVNYVKQRTRKTSH